MWTLVYGDTYAAMAPGGMLVKVIAEAAGEESTDTVAVTFVPGNIQECTEWIANRSREWRERG